MAGGEPLEQMDAFLEAWISYLREQNDRYTSKLLMEAVTLRGGDEGLLEEAKRTANRHPQLYIQILDKFFRNEDWRKLKEEGMEALGLMDRRMEIRDKAARMAASGAMHMGDHVSAREALKEAFYSKATAANYFRIITCESQEDESDCLTQGQSGSAVGTREILEQTEQLQKEWRLAKAVEECNWYYWQEYKETEPYIQDESDRMGICFLNGEYAKVLEECRKTKEALGWSGSFIGDGVPMLLLLLYEGEIWGKGIKAMLSEVKQYLGYQEAYGEADFSERYMLWRKKISVPAAEKKEILAYLVSLIDNRVEAIVGGSHRGSYFKAARLAAALGEVEESLGKADGKTVRMEKYLAQFPRHRSFKQEMKNYC